MTLYTGADGDARWDALASELRQRLEPGERVLWSGRPQQGLMFRKGDLLGIPFSLLWCGFAIFWESQVLSHNAPGFFALWGIPFILIGLYMVFGRFVVDAWQRQRTAYAVTDRRALILSGLWTPTLKSLDIEGLTDIELQEGSGARGTVLLGLAPTNNAANFLGRGWPGTSAYIPPAFERIADAASVFRIIRDARKHAQQDAAGDR
ncbi:MAG TPA: hypothetical protein VKB68_01295 [Stellaceae bacterium]|nr:hypothetical protein [Stellaceae bacterium]